MCLPLEPYKIEREWKHAGLSCVVTQNREAQNRCGYVRLPPGHPLHGQGYDVPNVDVHGGLTFAAAEPCAHDDGVGWWFGFDCAHCDDASLDPTLSREGLPENLRFLYDIQRKYPMPFGHAHFWLQGEVERECESLAEQFAAAQNL